MPQTPSSPSSSNRSLALSTNSVPIARTDKHVVLTNTSPARPKVASMQAKLDHTKIDMSLYKAPKESPSKVMPVPEETKGSVHLMITYDPSGALMTVRLMEVSHSHALIWFQNNKKKEYLWIYCRHKIYIHENSVELQIHMEKYDYCRTNQLCTRLKYTRKH